MAYENSTSVTITNTATGGPIWQGTLDKDEKYTKQYADGTANKYLTVEADKTVAVCVKYDVTAAHQGFYVPEQSGTLIGGRAGAVREN